MSDILKNFDRLNNLGIEVIYKGIEYIKDKNGWGIKHLINQGIKHVEIPEGIVKIHSDAFSSTNVETVDLPHTLTCIDIKAFNDCKKLTQIYIPDSVKVIGYSAFRGSGLISVRLPDGVTVKKNAFRLTNLRKLQGSNMTVEAHAFMNCRYMEYIELENLTANGSQIFSGCTNLKSVKITSNVDTGGVSTAIDASNMFTDCVKLEDVTMPSAFWGGCTNAFRRCLNLKTVEIPEGLRVLPEGIFRDSGLESAKLPESLQVISDRAFSVCMALQHINIPSQVKTIGKNAFRHTALESITLSNVKIEDSAFAESKLKDIHCQDSLIGSWAFAQCSKLKSVTVQNCTCTGAYLFDNCRVLEDVKMTNTNLGIWDGGNGMFSRCASLKDIPLEDIIYTAENVFDGCEGLRHVTIPDNTDRIGASMFSGCTCLETVDIPKSVKRIEAAAFNHCESLESIRTDCDSIEDFVFNGCKNLQTFEAPFCTRIGTSTLAGCDNLYKVDIRECVSLLNHVFEGCKSLKEVVLSAELLSSLQEKTYDLIFADCPLERIYVNGKQTKELDTKLKSLTQHKSIKIAYLQG